MKVIDLLNKIANGEEVPKKIKVNGRVYEFYEEFNDYLHNLNNIYYNEYLFDEVISNYDNVKIFLNEEVEIIEDKPINEIKFGSDKVQLWSNGKLINEIKSIEDTPKKIEKIDEWEFNQSEEDIPHFELAKKLNEIIDYINEGKE